ncbi:MAG TPA: VanZ family protein, partial [Bacteroidales bacterium]|nr:VanZ family protein [Bacteroidales bacterium]
ILFSLQRIYWFIAGLLFASASEMVQYALFYRAFNINDMIANMIGIMTGFLLLWIWLTLKKDFPVD